MIEVTSDWYLTLSAILFSIGFLGMMVRKNALIMFMCIELMLNAGVDLFCLGNNLIYDPDYIPKSINAIVDLVNSKKISESRISESIQRVNVLKRRYNINER